MFEKYLGKQERSGTFGWGIVVTAMRSGWLFLLPTFALFTPIVSVFPAYAFSSGDLEDLLELRQCDRCNLREANLAGAYLRQSSLRRANLRGANLNGTDLRGSFLQNADLNENVTA